MTIARAIEATLRAIEARNGELNAFTAVTRERALAAARRLDERRGQGKALGPLAGVPFAVKNLYDVAGIVTLAGSRINANRPSASSDAVLIERLEAAGAILVGATGMGEYADDFTGRNAHYGATRNPRDPERMTGGSSGGSAAAVAAGLVPLALGSDTNGSIRVPASLCGVFGLKPTFGRLSRRGTFPFVASFDHLGPFARSVRELALAYDALQGFDAADPACVERPVEPVAAELDGGIAGLRIAIAEDYAANGAMPEAHEAVARAAAALGVEQRVTLPHAAEACAAAALITAAEGGALHLERLRARAMDFDPDTRDRFLAGALVPAAWIHRAQRFRQQYRRRVAALFETIDIILTPATPIPAPRLDQSIVRLGERNVPVPRALGQYTQPISFIGLPAASVPIAGLALPLGVQIIGRPWREDQVLRVASELERRSVAAA